jgi:sugar/nucleoside kinase (ribokinase family)
MAAISKQGSSNIEKYELHNSLPSPPMSLLVVGTVAFDGIETPSGAVDNVIGGSANYFAWAASYLTAPIHLVSIIGDDYPAAEIKKLEERGVHTEGLKRVAGAKSFYWAGKYHEDLNGRDTLTTDLNVLADFDPELPEPCKTIKYVMLGNLTPAIQISVIRQFSTRPTLIALDTMNYWIDSAGPQLEEVLGMVDILIINDQEARQISGEKSLLLAAEKIQEMGPRAIAIKKGEHGSLLFSRENGQQKTFFAPALPLAVVTDPTGAGDTFAGGFMGYMALVQKPTFENFKRAMIYGAAMASFCVEDFSLRKLQDITDTEIRTRINEFKDLVHFEINDPY